MSSAAPANSASTNLTPGETAAGEESMTTSPEEGRNASLPARGRKTGRVAAREDCRVLTIDGNGGRSTLS
uniref:Uncharacterized protein n=1 Tax=Arundo donax TaxID=35708 RepID=A0A0A9GZ56_ARUDO